MRAANQIHLKYVDDLTLAEAINLPEQLVTVLIMRELSLTTTMPGPFYAIELQGLHWPGQDTYYPTIIAKCLNNSKEHKP